MVSFLSAAVDIADQQWTPQSLICCSQHLFTSLTGPVIHLQNHPPPPAHTVEDLWRPLTRTRAPFFVRRLYVIKKLHLRIILGILKASGVHRLFEGQGRKERHLSVRFCSQEGTFACVLSPKKALLHVFCLPRGHFSVCFGSQEGTLAHVLAPKRALLHVFCLPRGHFSMRFASQKSL